MSRKTIDFSEYMPTTPEGFARVWWRDGVLNFEDVRLRKSGAFELYTIEQMRDYAMHAVKRALEQQPVDEPVACVAKADLKKLKDGDTAIKAFAPPATGDSEVALYARPQPAAPEHPAESSASSSSPKGPSI